LVQCGCIKPLINTVEFSNPKTIRVALEGLENILKSGQDSVGSGERNPYVQYVEECDGFNIVTVFFSSIRVEESFFWHRG
jgi:hypothetical protein